MRVIIGIDPGGTTGFCVLTITSDGPNVSRLTVSPEASVKCDAYALLQAHPNATVVCEGWENQGKRLNITSTIAPKLIGMMEGYAHMLGMPFDDPKASIWKTQFAVHADLLPQPERFPKTHQRMANATYQALGYWPSEKFRGIQKSYRKHALDALGLSIWYAFTTRRGMLDG